MASDVQKARVLVVEDETLVAMLIEDMLSEIGCEIAGVVGQLPQALSFAEGGSFDLAILDVNLDGTPSYPVADILRARGIPFVFATGYGAEGIEAEYARAPVVAKPFVQSALEAAMRRALTSAKA